MIIFCDIKDINKILNYYRKKLNYDILKSE